METRPKVCIDRILPRDLMRFNPNTRGPEGRVRAIAVRNKPWINGSTLNVRFIGGTPAEQEIVINEAKWWTDVANLRIVFNDAGNAEIRIAFDQSDGAWSYIGTDCSSIPMNQPTMNLGFLDKGTAAHEFGHALGLAHEHQNPAGGIIWNEEVVIREAAKSPNFWDEQTTRHNILNKYSIDQIKFTEFDGDSIMLYFFPASWTLNNMGTHANEVLSQLDKSFVAGAEMYPKTGPTPTSAVELKVNAGRRTSASIARFGEEDIFRFTAEVNGQYVIDTRGPTDVVMKLFGPNNETTVIAEDDDSGYGTNARINASLTAGEYFVQVRHYNRQSGVGKYSIKVRMI